MNDKECSIFNMGYNIYIIPTELLDKFEATPYDDRDKEFSQFILEEGGVIENVLINSLEYENFLEQW